MDNKPMPAGEVLKQDESHVLRFANLVKKFQEMGADLDWNPYYRSVKAYYDYACDMVDNEDLLDLTDYEAEVLITVFVAEAVRAAANTAQ